MGPSIIARNYAEALLALARKHGGEPAVDEYGRAIDGVATLLANEPRVRRFLESPLVEPDAKKQALQATFDGRVPALFLRFLLVVVDKRRQALLGEIAEQYQALVDEQRGIVRAQVLLAFAPDAELEREITGALERRVGRAVVPRFEVDPTLIGGVLIRIGDRVFDGSLRRRAALLRRRLLEAPLPEPAA